MTARFQQLMDKMFADMHFVAFYVEVIATFSRSCAEHIEHMQAVSNRFTASSIIDKREEAFKTLKKSISDKSLLTHSESDQRYHLGVDACDIGLGAWMSQKKD
eukprot:IDg12585t1